MLPERSFALGGYILVAGGVLLLATLAATDTSLYFFPEWLSGALLVLFGFIFLYVGHQARQDRRALLRLGDPESNPSPAPPKTQ